jgi:hypothetical protein
LLPVGRPGGRTAKDDKDGWTPPVKKERKRRNKGK